MAKAKNKVIAGDYVGKSISGSFGIVSINVGVAKLIYLNNETVESYEVVTDEHVKSVKSGISRGLVGSFLLGPVGGIVGATHGKVKGVYQVAIQFKSGERSLVEVDDKIYKAIIKNCF